jgi:vitamin B12 transporter
MVKSSVIFLLLLVKISFFGASAYARGESELEPMVVVETRSPVPLSETSPWVTRISGEDLIERQIYNLSDALRSVPGMAIAKTGQLGSQTSLFSRGGESNHVTYIYEGRKLNGGFSGTYNLGELSTLGSSSLEVIRGSSSNLYGANAIGGSVYLRNELPEIDGAYSQANLAFGSFDLLKTGYQSSFKNGDLAGNIGLMTLETENDRPNSKFENISSSFHFQKEMPNDVSINLLGLGYLSDFGTVGAIYNSPTLDNFMETEQYLLSPQIKVKGPDWDFQIKYSFSEDEIFSYSPNYQTNSLTEHQEIDALINIENSDIISFQIGISYSTQYFQQEGYNSWNAYNLPPTPLNWNNYDRLEQLSTFISSSYSLSETTKVEASVRYDDYSDFGDPTTYSFQLKHSIDENLNTFSRYSTGFAPPNVLELYGAELNNGNPDLISEKSVNYEIGVKLQNDELTNNFQISYFYTNYKNLISGYPIAENIKNTRVSGLEISSQSRLNENFTLNTSMSYLMAKNKDSGEDFLDRRPEFLGSLILTYTNASFSLGTELNTRYNTKEKDFNAPFPYPFVEADDFLIVGLFSSYKFTEGLQVFSRIDNVFDKEYEEVDGYPALGMNANAGIRYTF